VARFLNPKVSRFETILARRGAVMVDFSDRENVKRWLDAVNAAKRRREVAVAIAARASLRATPRLRLSLGESRPRATVLSDWVLPSLRATALAWAAAKYPGRGSELRGYAAAADYAARVAADAADETYPYAIDAYAAIDASNAAAAAAASAAHPAAVARADDAAVSDAAKAAAHATDAYDADAAFVAACASDVDLIDAGGSGSELMESPLWPNRAPDLATVAWTDLRAALLGAAEGWEVWTNWYEARLAGDPDHPQNEALEIARATIPDEIWKQGPAVVNAEIKRLIGEATKTLEQGPGRWDFFVSYAVEDETFAREFVNVLEGAGYSTVAQFKDFSVGANFVHEMNRGLAGAGRVVALYSQHYQDSEHCQAEWAAAYNSDPSGAKRKLIPFLLAPTALGPLARQVVYKSLVGLNTAQRTAAILEAIASRPPARNPEEIKSILAKVASPQASINPKEQLDAGPNVTFDRPFVDTDLPELPSIQRGLANTILDSLPGNTPPVVRSVLRKYDEHLLERGAQPIVRYLDDLAAALREERDTPEAGDWGGRGLAELFRRFFANHALLRTHFPLKGEEIFAELPIDEDEATGDALTEPIKNVAAAMEEVVAVDKATAAIAKAVNNSAAFANDLASLPPAPNAPDPQSTHVTVKRRYVLGTIGFLATIYELVGTTASIYGVPEGAALLQAVGKAIEKLMSLLL
jgi:hypothetical protein